MVLVLVFSLTFLNNRIGRRRNFWNRRRKRKKRLVWNGRGTKRSDCWPSRTRRSASRAPWLPPKSNKDCRCVLQDSFFFLSYLGLTAAITPPKRESASGNVFRFISMEQQVNHLRAYTFSCVTQCMLHIDVTFLRLLYPCLYHRNIPRFKKRAHCVTKVDHGVS